MADRRDQDPAAPWFEKAGSDLRSAEALLALKPPELATGVFHCQQAGEKYRKGLLAHLGEDPPRTHDLVALLDLLVSTDSRLASPYEAAGAPALARRDALSGFYSSSAARPSEASARKKSRMGSSLSRSSGFTSSGSSSPFSTPRATIIASSRE